MKFVCFAISLVVVLSVVSGKDCKDHKQCDLSNECCMYDHATKSGYCADRIKPGASCSPFLYTEKTPYPLYDISCPCVSGYGCSSQLIYVDEDEKTYYLNPKCREDWD